MVVVYVLIAIAVILIIGIISIYNRLKIMRNRIENAWSQIDVQLKRRYDLIPNLVETVKGYAAHEKGTFERVTQARNMAINAKTVKEQGEAENMLTGALKSLFAVSEAYPELKANQNFMMLQEELAGTEGKIAYARQFHNDCVMKYQTKKELFPSNIVAGMFNFPDKEYFEIEEAAEREAPKVSFTPAQ
jgi:LemA protein